MRRYLPFAIIGLIFVIAAGGGLLLFRSKNVSTPIRIVPGKPGAEPAHIRGSDQARVTLEEFGDYQCVPCHFLAKTLLKVEHDYGTKVRIIFRHYPLKKHVHAYTAACAAEAAGVQGRFWEMHDLLFQNSPQWGKETPRPIISLVPNAPDVSPEEKAAEVRAIFAGYAEKLGLDVERFKRDMDSEQVRGRIRSDQERAASVGVDRTPSVFMNGLTVPYTSFDEVDLRRTLDAELSGQTPTPVPPTPGSNLQIPTPTPPK
ncbi:MAG TPA: thioredoxin domain-containing protein [Chthoniobacterales bacterium]|nr:thioredoxin domain-containing protein [Chthoniobacterales bacterium]